MDAGVLARQRLLRGLGPGLALVLALGAGCGDGLRTNEGSGGTGPTCLWKNLCVCLCDGAPTPTITPDACEASNGTPCVPGAPGSGAGGANDGGGTAGGAGGGGQAGASAIYQDCALDHTVCMTT